MRIKGMVIVDGEMVDVHCNDMEYDEALKLQYRLTTLGVKVYLGSPYDPTRVDINKRRIGKNIFIWCNVITTFYCFFQ